MAVTTPWPDRGPVGGGAIVILTGAGFGPEASMLFHNTGIGIMKDVSKSHLPSV